MTKYLIYSTIISMFIIAYFITGCGGGSNSVPAITINPADTPQPQVHTNSPDKWALCPYNRYCI